MAGDVRVWNILLRIRVRIGGYGRSPQTATGHTRERCATLYNCPEDTAGEDCIEV
ncbi:MAG: hypothetical protein WHT29_11810 [Bacteroidales bacterium]